MVLPRARSSIGESLIEQILRNLAAVFRKLYEHLLVQPDVHRRGIIFVTGVAELGREFFACLQAGIHTHEFHQIYDRFLPIESLGIFRSHLCEDGVYVDRSHGSGCWGSGRAGAGRCP